MNITNKTVLVTGGGSGIGLAIAQQLSAKNNKVIITGRNAEKLTKAAEGLPNTTAVVADVTNTADVDKLINTIKTDFGGLDIVVNNAGHSYLYTLDANENAAAKGLEEFNTNFFSILNLNEQLLPMLSASPEAAIVNVSSILAFVPRATLPTYSASKAALHSYTRALRFTLRNTNIKVFELMPPLVNTDFSKEIGGENGIPPSQVADELINAFETDHYEIHVGNTAYVYGLTRTDPAAAFSTINVG